MEPLDPELAALFEREPVPLPSESKRTRMFERVAASVAIAHAIDASSAASATASAIATTARLGRRAIALAMTTFALGAVVGAGAVVVLRPPEQRVVYVDRPVPAPSPSSVRAEDPPVSPYSLPSVPTTPRSSSGPSSTHDTLKEERALIEDARSKLAAGQAQAALSRLDEHAREYPKARLAEEREALAIQALVNVQRYDDARTRAAAFREHWATSVYLPAVETTLQSIP